VRKKEEEKEIREEESKQITKKSKQMMSLFILIGAPSCLNSFRAWWTWRTIWCTYGRLFYWCRLDWIILQAGKTYERDTFSGRVITTIGRGRQE
jgi:hypothetical protein